MRRGVARQALQAQSDFHQLPHARLLFPQLRELGRLERVFELDVQNVWDELGDAVHLGKRHVERAPGVAQHGFGAHGSESDDLADVLPPVFFGDVVDYFPAPPHAEININVGEADALGVEEAFEEQAACERVNVGDME